MKKLSALFATLLLNTGGFALAAPTLLNTVDLSPGADAGSPDQFALNASTHKLYVLGVTSGLQDRAGLKVIDTTTGQVKTGVSLAVAPHSLDDGSFQPVKVAVDDSAGPSGNKVYVVGSLKIYGDSRYVLRVVDGATDTSLTDPSNDLILQGNAVTYLIGVVANPVNHKVYVLNANQQLFIIDGPNRKILANTKLPIQDALTTVVSKTNNKVFYFGEGNGQAAVVDGATDAITTLTVPFTSAFGAAIDDAAGIIYVSAQDLSTHEPRIYKLNASTGAFISSAATGVSIGARASRANTATVALALDSAKGTVYLATDYAGGYPAGNILSFDAATLSPKQTFPHQGYRLAFDAGRLFMIAFSAENADAVGIIEAATGIYSRTTVAYQPGSVAINSQAGRVFLYDNGANEVPVIDIATGAVVNRFPVLGARQGGPDADSEPRSIAVSARLNRFYITRLGDNRVSDGFGGTGTSEFLDVYAGDTGQLVTSVSLDAVNHFHNGFIAVDDAHHRIYITGGGLYVVDQDANTLITTLSGLGDANGVAVNPVTRRVYVTSGAGVGKLAIIDGATNAVVTTLDTSAGRPGAIAVNTRTNQIYLGNRFGDNHNIEIVDGDSDSIVGTFNDGSGNPYSAATGVAVDEATNTLFVLDDSLSSTDYTGGVLAFDASNNYQQVGQVELGDLPFGLAFDSTSRELFVSNEYQGTVSVVKGDTAPAAGPPFANISTRLKVEKGDNAGIAGFIITGPAGSTKKILIRGRGPSLAQDGVSGTLSDPFLSLRDAVGGPPIENDNWQSGDTSQIPAAFQERISPRDSIIVATLPVGSNGVSNYTAILKGATPDDTGVGLIELYDLEPGSAPAKLVNIATRGLVQTGDNALFAGIIIGGDSPVNVLLRVTGPSLKNNGVSNYLADPMLFLFDANGTLRTSNDNWQDTQKSEITDTQLQPRDSLEPAIKVTLSSGLYTAIVRGQTDTTGVAVVEAYKLP